MAGEGKYDTIVIYDVDGTPKAYAENMPIFVLLAQDELATTGIDGYADGLDDRAARAAIDGELDRAEHLRQQAADVRAFSGRVRVWQAENPDRVGLPD